jgi:hypothetical protein
MIHQILLMKFLIVLPVKLNHYVVHVNKALLVLMDSLVPLEKTVFLVMALVNQDLQVLMLNFMTESFQFHLNVHVLHLLDNLVLPAPLVLMDNLDHLVNLEMTALLGHKECLDLKAHPVKMDPQANEAHLGNPVFWILDHQYHLDLLVHPVDLDHQEFLENLDHPVKMVIMDHLVLQVNLGLVELLDQMDLLVNKDDLENPVHLELVTVHLQGSHPDIKPHQKLWSLIFFKIFNIYFEKNM